MDWRNNIYQGDMLKDIGILHTILDIMPSGIQIVNSSGIIKYVNSAFLRIVGVKIEDRIGRSIFDVSPDGSVASVLRTGRGVQNLRNHPKGTNVELVSSASPIIYNGQMQGVIAVVSDINDVIVLTEQLKESRNMVKNLSQKIRSLTSVNYVIDDLIGSSSIINRVKEMIKIASQNDTTVLIQGETGTGKEIAAQAVHSAGPRAKKPFISINCSAVPLNLLESEFFGHEKGSFTGAYKTRLGKFELSNGGTLFLDEIGDMDVALQAKILRAIEEKEIQRIGGQSRIPLDVRIVAATNRDLKKLSETGQFRQDLYYRLSVWNITIPPLRERKDDILELSMFLLNRICRKLGKRNMAISTEALDIIKKYNWPGNVRELENVLERIVLSSNDKQNIEGEDLKMIFKSPETITSRQSIPIMSINEAEKIIIKEAIRKYGLTYEGKKEISKALCISLATLYNKMNKYKLLQEENPNENKMPYK